MKNKLEQDLEAIVELHSNLNYDDTLPREINDILKDIRKYGISFSDFEFRYTNRFSEIRCKVNITNRPEFFGTIPVNDEFIDNFFEGKNLKESKLKLIIESLVNFAIQLYKSLKWEEMANIVNYYKDKEFDYYLKTGKVIEWRDI